MTASSVRSTDLDSEAHGISTQVSINMSILHLFLDPLKCLLPNREMFTYENVHGIVRREQRDFTAL